MLIHSKAYTIFILYGRWKYGKQDTNTTEIAINISFVNNQQRFPSYMHYSQLK